MREIPKKNYYILVVIIVVTVILTLSLASVYRNKSVLVSNFYNYANKITSDEFDEYMLENSDLIMYISDKYDLSNEAFEKKLKKKIDGLNLKDKLIYIDKSELTKTFLKKLSEEYDINISANELPMLVVIIDKKIIKTVPIKLNSNVDSIIDYEAFE